MTIEYIRYQLTKHGGDELISAYQTASKSLCASPHCLGFDLAQCEEAPDTFVLRIHWTSTEDHLQKFRKGPYFPPFLAAIQPFVSEIVEMRHYGVTSVEWSR